MTAAAVRAPLAAPSEADDCDTAPLRLALPDGVDHIPNSLNALILIAQLTAIFTCFHFAAMLRSAWAMALLAFTFALIQFSVYSIIHEAQHGVLFTSARANAIGGIIAASFFPAPFHLMRQGHIGHHLRNRSDDEALEFWFGGESPLWKWMQWIGILTGFFYVMIVLGNVIVLALPFLLNRRWFKFDRPSAAFMDALNPKYARMIQLEAVAILILHAAIILLMRIPLPRYLILYGSFGFLWSALQYVHHYGTERHITRGARNLWILWPIDKLWLDHNWHRVHHEHPTVSWIHLQRIGQAQVRSGKAEPRRFLPWCYLRMWAGPRRATAHIVNRFAGKVIR
jgi:fatty acid desaturase